MSDQSVTQIPERDDPRRTITSTSAHLETWADQQRQRAPELDWERFGELLEELRAAVPGCGPVKSEEAYYRGLSIIQMMVEKLLNDDADLASEAYVLEAALEQFDKAIKF